MTWERIQNRLLVIFIAIIALLGTHLIVEHLAEGKPRCAKGGDILWSEDNQEQLYDIWACREHFSEAQQIAIYEIGYRLVSGGYKMDDKLMDRIYEILTGKKK